MNREETIEIIRSIDNKPNIYKALTQLQAKFGIEIGVREGGNLANLAQNPFFSQGMLYGLDCWREDPEHPEINDLGFSQEMLNAQYFNCIHRFAHVPHVGIVREYSVEGASKFTDNYFDFIYIDAAHDYESVKNDLRAWWPKLREGGVFGGHDYFPDHRVWRGVPVGVFQAVNEFVQEVNSPVIHTTDVELEGGPGVACTSFFMVK